MVLPFALGLLGLGAAGHYGKSMLDDMINERRMDASGARMGGILDQSMGEGGAIDRGMFAQNLMRGGYAPAGHEYLQQMFGQDDRMDQMMFDRQTRQGLQASGHANAMELAQFNADLRARAAMGQPLPPMPNNIQESFRTFDNMQLASKETQRLMEFAQDYTDLGGFFGEDASARRGEAAALLGQLKPKWAQAMGLGVINEGDMELIDSWAKDPDAFFSSLTSADSGTLARLQVVQSQFDQKAQTEAMLNAPTWGMYGLQAQQSPWELAQGQAEAAGLTSQPPPPPPAPEPVQGPSLSGQRSDMKELPALPEKGARLGERIMVDGEEYQWTEGGWKWRNKDRGGRRDRRNR